MSQTSYLEKYGTGAPWQEGKAPIVRFVTDDHKVIGVMFGHITRTYEDRLGQYLMITSSAGVIVIRGPEVSAYHEKLAQGIADLVEANGKEITSVLYYEPAYPPTYGESEEELDPEEIAERT
jgi:hypothetical protein